MNGVCLYLLYEPVVYTDFTEIKKTKKLERKSNITG